MDQKIVRQIIGSCETVMRNLGDEKNADKISESFPVLNQTSVSAFATSLTNLLAYKISPDAHQRYSARIQIIELLREWIRAPSGLHLYPTFYQGDNTSEFTHILIQKYLNREILGEDNEATTNLVTLGRILLNLSNQNHQYIPHLKSFLEALPTSCNQTVDFIEDVISHQSELQLEPALIDKLYVTNARKFFETPLVDCFITNLHNLIKKRELSTSDDFLQMIKLISESPRLFQVASSVLKELFTHCDYSLIVIDYVDFILKNVASCKNMCLDLYPMHLQSCIVMMKIDINYHTKNSMNCIMKSLSDIYLKNRDEAFCLMLHYPNWLDVLSTSVREFI